MAEALIAFRNGDRKPSGEPTDACMTGAMLIASAISDIDAIAKFTVAYANALAGRG